MVDPRRFEAAFQWVVNFYGQEIGLPVVTKAEDLWKEHIISLAYLCKTKVAGKHPASSAQEAYDETKKIIRDQEGKYNLQRWKELDSGAAAKGDQTAIYKFLVLLFHLISGIVDDYITESQNFLNKSNLSRPFADLLHDVNHNTQSDWWQGSGSVMPSPATCSAVTSSPTTENTSFGKYCGNDIPSTPRTPFMKSSRIQNTHLSPIQTAISSPVTLKIKQDEYRRTREQVIELEYLVHTGKLDLEEAQKDAARYKEASREWRLKYEDADATRKTLEQDVNQLINNIEELKRKNDQAISHGRELQSRYSNANLERTRIAEEKGEWMEQKRHLEDTKTKLERDLRDVTEAMACLNQECASLQALNHQSSKNNAKLASELAEKSAEVEFIRANQRTLIREKGEQLEEMVIQIDELNIQLSNTRKEAKELAEKLARKEEELNERQDAFNRERSAVQLTHKRQIELLENINAKLQNHLVEANQRIEEKDVIIAEEREKLMSRLDDSEKQLSARSELKKALDKANIEICDLRLKLSEICKMQMECETEKSELERKLLDKSLEIRASNERMELLEKQFARLEKDKKEEEEPIIKSDTQPEIQPEQRKEELLHVEEAEETIIASEPAEISDLLRIQPVPETSESGEDLKHVNFGLDEDDNNSCTMLSKSLFGTDYEKTLGEANRMLEQSVDRERIEELQRRNSALPPALRASYVAEVCNYNSPSASEENIKKKKPVEFDDFKVPLTPGAFSLSKTSIQSFEDKENRPDSVSKGGSVSRRKSIAKAFGFGKK